MFSHESHGKEQKRRFTIFSTCIVIVALLVLATISSKRSHLHTVSKGVNFFKTSVDANAAVAGACNSAPHPAACTSALSGTSAKSPEDIFTVTVESAKLHAASAHASAYDFVFRHTKSKAGKAAAVGRPAAFDVCLELMEITLEQLDGILATGERAASSPDIHTWLSAALTNQVTCTDELGAAAGIEPQGVQAMAAQVDLVSKCISNALALHTSSPNASRGGRRGLSDGFPEWVTAADRRLLEASPGDVEADAVVAQDGSGTHRSIGEAIAFVSLQGGGAGAGGGGRSVIYVKAGTYNEYIRIATKQKNVMLMGDGKGISIIIGSRNVEDGSSTYQSATVAAMGGGFIAKGITIINSSGPTKQQAVALRVGGDLSVVYQCSIQGYQDTLYAYANRQFYRDCDISGTVDFIFGNSAAVLQNCFIHPLKPAGGQMNTITAQGRTDPNQNTGFSIHSCQIAGATGGAPTYLGRPWKQYSRVVYLKTAIDDSVSSAGWERWSGNFALSTLYYGEYENTGPGAGTSGWVKWPGVHPAMSTEEALKFTVANFIFGNSWLPATGVVFNDGL